MGKTSYWLRRCQGWDLMPPRIEPGYVYFVIAGPFVKIGWTMDPIERVGQIGRQLPFQVRDFFFRHGSKLSERRCHVRFRPYRTRGEWFRLEGELAEFVGWFDTLEGRW